MIKSVQTTLGGMKENSQSLKVPKQSWGASARDIEKTLMIKSVQTTLGGMKKNSQSLKVPKQSWGHEEKSKGSKNFEHAKKKKKTNTMMLKTK
jgi:hypothetical protein